MAYKVKPVPDSKICTICNIEKPKSEYYLLKGRYKYKQCRLCTIDLHKKYAGNKKEKLAEINNSLLGFIREEYRNVKIKTDVGYILTSNLSINDLKYIIREYEFILTDYDKAIKYVLCTR